MKFWKARALILNWRAFLSFPPASFCSLTGLHLNCRMKEGLPTSLSLHLLATAECIVHGNANHGRHDSVVERSNEQLGLLYPPSSMGSTMTQKELSYSL
ncbi:hypothetical protein BC830DRAFT_1118281, partial [Chytriomyces sp. MP71]